MKSILIIALAAISVSLKAQVYEQGVYSYTTIAEILHQKYSTNGIATDSFFKNVNNEMVFAIKGSDPITISFNRVNARPTTLAGYGITDAQSPLISGSNIKTINGTSVLGSGDITISGGGSSPITVTHLAANQSNATTTGTNVSGLNTTLAAGTYAFKYYVLYRSTATTTGVKFGVNFTGTKTAFVANMSYAGTGAAASTGAATQAVNGTTGNVGETRSTRTNSTTAPNLGPTISVDAANADMLCMIEGLIVVTVSGSLQLWHGSETAVSTTVMAGSSLVLTKTN